MPSTVASKASTKTSSPLLLLSPQRGTALQLVCVTMPLFLVCLYFIFDAAVRPSKPLYQLGDDATEEQYEEALEETGQLISLIDMETVFLTLHMLWTAFLVYIGVFIPKRRHLIGRYLSEGETCLGDVVYDKNSRSYGSFHDYGYALYPHPNEEKVVRKRVRVYQNYTRERVAILRLPGRPLSGQSKIDLEIDLNASIKERDSKNTVYIIYLAVFWVVFSIFGAAFTMYETYQITDQQDNSSKATKLFLILAGLNVPLAYALNWLRFIVYRNWMVNRGAIVEDSPDVRRITGCFSIVSEDGSDVIPYSILHPEEMSYQGSLPSHSLMTSPTSGSLPVLHPGSSGNSGSPNRSQKPQPKKTWVTLGS